jgi:hypothetical protein
MENLKCPLCDSTDTKLREKVSLGWVVSRISNRNKQVENEIRNIWGGDSCNFMSCNECSFGFASPFKGGTDKLYSLIYDKSSSYPEENPEYDFALKQISSEDTCLEIGSGDGFFLKKLSNKCKKKNIYSVEISNNKSDYKTIHEVPDKKKFSAFFMFAVLEHLEEFKEVMDKINTTSTKDAKLFIVVPHAEGVEHVQRKLGFGNIPPIHITEWNKKTIEKLTGWEIVDYRIKTMSPFENFKSYVYGIRTLRYPKTRNIFKLLNCVFKALMMTEFKKIKTGQYFYLKKTGGKK